MVLSTANFTKSLRDKSKPLLGLLPTAQSVCRGEVALFFPGKEEWLVEWLVERLEDGTSSDGRLSPDAWNTLYDLLNTPDLSLTAASTTLRKHKFAGIIAKTLLDAVATYSSEEEEPISSNNDAEDIEMRDSASSTSSSATEPGSPLLRTTYARANRHRIKREWTRRGQQVEVLLSAMFRVVEYLKVRFEGGSGRDQTNPKRRRLDLTTPIFKFSPETAAELCESYFKLLFIVVQGLGWVDGVVNWTVLCQMIWKSCSYGVSDTSKLASLVSGKLLQPMSMILSVPSLPHDIREIIAGFLSNYIFQPISAPKEKRSEFLNTFKPLADAFADQKSASIPESIALSLPVILELAIEKADRDYSVKQRRHADGFVSILLSWMLSTTKNHLTVHTEILDIAIRNKVTVEEAALKNSIKLALRQPSNVDWAVLQAVAKIDLDVLLSTEGDTVFDMISGIDTKVYGEGVWRFIQQIVTVSVEARDLESLFERWFTLLGRDAENQTTVWRSDRFQLLMASNVEIGLTQSQIQNVFKKYSSSETIKISLPIVDSILRGVTRIETIDKLGSEGLVISLFNDLSIIPPKIDESKSQWQYWRVLLRVLDMWPGLEFSSKIGEIKDILIKRTTTLLSGPKLKTDMAKELSILLTLVLVFREHEYIDVEELEGVLKGITPRIKSTKKVSWDGNFDKISSFPDVAVSFVHTITSRFVTLLRQLDDNLLREFFLSFLRKSSEATVESNVVSLKSAWSSFVRGDSKVYEDVKVKDVFFTAILEVLRVEKPSGRQLSAILDVFTECPLATLRKSQREGIIDELFLVIKQTIDPEERRKVLEVMVRLARLSTNSSALATSIGSPDGLYGLFIASDTNLNAITDLAKTVIRHLAESRHHEKAETQLLEAIVLADTMLDKTGAADIRIRAWSHAVVQGVIHIANDDKEDAVKEKIYSLIDKLSAILIRLITDPAKDSETEGGLQQRSLDLEFLEPLVLLVKNRGEKGITDFVPANKVAGLRSRFDSMLLGHRKSSSDQSLIFYARAISTIASDDGRQATDIAFLLAHKGLYEPFRSSYTSTISRLEPLAIFDLLKYASDAVFPASSQIPSSFYLILQDILGIAVAKKSSDAQLDSQISFIFSQLALAGPACDDFESLRVLLNTTSILIKDKGLSISQLNIEETLASISITVSSHGPQFTCTMASTDQIFIPTCGIMASILSGQRFRIKNRHGLVTATLEALMSLLFIPRVTGRKKSDTEIHPPWLANAKSWTVTKEAAVSYCRLLTMLCDPSTSSVRMNRKSDNLSSATVAARKAVEPHVPGILKRYINLNLTHHLTPDVRAALTPGLYAMFDVMQESTLRSLNMSLDNPGRVVFKALYEDWNKFGKWVD
ncbi:hypothetical protein TWF970_002465 [Orbilia oligospora]|uniref:Nucleolar 27S pre-rRNA processing Urb2/Npa2 C-terminal domain-containing protein n=1 Tax=Orbilia oligospora TaxID=2813651 RepID=A0A7C8VIL1_ORBOL|nr:hypothetical protein TWF970_002465 [Orbilia oligospora]